MRTRPARAVRHRRAVAAVAVAAALLTGACSGDDSPDAGAAGAVTPSAQPTPQTLSPEQLAGVVKVRTKALNKAARKFERCESNGIAGYGFNTCWRRSLPATQAAADLAATIRAAGPSAAPYAAVLHRLDLLAESAKAIQKGCGAGDDQRCDQALMRYRDGVQKVQWELDLV